MHVFKKLFFEQVRKRNCKLPGVRHAFDVQFHFDKEMQDVNDLKKDVQNTLFVRAVEDLQDAINRAEAEEKKETTQKSSIAFVHLFNACSRPARNQQCAILRYQFRA